MAWFWTDDLARVLIEAGVAERSAVADWVDRPVALAGPEGADPLQFAQGALGVATDRAVGAA